jgi:RND family efflux transporter MFP subunit
VIFVMRYVNVPGVVTALMLSCFVFVAGCSRDDKPVPAGAEASEAVKADLLDVSETELPEVRSFIGRVRAKVTAELVARMPGYVVSVSFDKGDLVKVGDVVARLDDRELQEEIKALAASLDSIRDERRAVFARYEYVKSNFYRIQRLFDDNASTRDEFERARSEFVSLQGKLDALDAEARVTKSRLDAARSRLDYFILKSPVNGMITNRYVDKGTYANPGQKLFVIEGMDSGFWFEADIDSALADELLPGTEVDIQLDKSPGFMKAPVTKVVRSVKHASKTFTVLVDMGARRLVPGMFGRVYVPLGTVEKIIVPKEAVVDRNGIKGVFVINDGGRAMWRLVRTGRLWRKTGDGRFAPASSIASHEEEFFWEILSGVMSGDSIVVSNLDAIKEGSRIE